MSSPSSSTLQQLHRLNRSSPDFHDQLCNVLYGEEYVQCVPNIEGEDLVWLVDYLDKALDGLDPPSPASRKCLRELRSRCGTGAILPTSYTLSPDLLSIGPEPFASGGFGDVYKGTLNGSRVCIKRARVYTRDPPKKAIKAFCQEAVMWKRLTHLNVLPLLGVTIVPLQLVSDWMSGGDLPEYIEKHSNADRLGLLSDVANGLCYLHSCNVIHGDLKGPNVLVDDSGRARIADFGLTTITRNLDSIPSASCHHGHTPRWTAQEVLMGGTHSKESDIFSFAMVMIEVFTGAIPFSNTTSAMATFAIMQSRRPPRPTHPTFTEHLWGLMQRCWDPEPHLRPEVSEALQILLTSGDPAWKRLISHTHALRECISLITTIFSDLDQVEMVEQLSGDDAQSFIDTIDEALESLTPEIRRRCLRCSRKICGREALVPRSLVHGPTGNLNIAPDPFASGSYSDVYHGTLDGLEVCIKRFRVFTNEDSKKVAKTFCREAVMWKNLKHPNIVPLMGITLTPLQLISDRMSGGEMSVYIKKHPDVDRLKLLSDVAEGLCYLHSCNMVHGDLKGSNILMDNYGHARIADSGLAMVTQNLDSIRSISSQHGNTPRWAAPEVLKEGIYSKEADVFSFAMVMIEVFTGAVPFSDKKNAAAMFDIMSGLRPPRPTHPTFTAELWMLMQNCWNQDPHLRPVVSEVLKVLCGVDCPAWKWLISTTLATYKHIPLITMIFSDRDQVKAVRNLSGDDAQAFVDKIDEVLESLPPQIHRKCLRYLYSICDHQALVPRSLEIPLCYDPTENPVSHGEAVGLWKGRHEGRKVAAQVLKQWLGDDVEQTRKRFCRVVVTWRALHHPNVLPLLGVTMDENRLVMVSEWMSNGNIREFTKANTNVNRSRLLRDVTRGLIYMHDQRMIHGDLKGVNILIDNGGHARLTGFNLVTIASEDQSTMISPATAGGTIPWMSPELLYPEKFGLEESHLTKESDCYALGMVIYEVLSGQVPFSRWKDPEIVHMVLDGERPERLEGDQGKLFTDEIWQVLERCWQNQPGARPSAKTILRGLEGNLSPLGPSSDTDGSVETDSDDQSNDIASGSVRPPIARSGDGLLEPPRKGNPKGRWFGWKMRILEKKKLFGRR